MIYALTFIGGVLVGIACSSGFLLWVMDPLIDAFSGIGRRK